MKRWNLRRVDDKIIQSLDSLYTKAIGIFFLKKDKFWQFLLKNGKFRPFFDIKFAIFLRVRCDVLSLWLMGSVLTIHEMIISILSTQFCLSNHNHVTCGLHVAEPKCTEIWSEKVPVLSHLGPIWHTLGPNMTSLTCVLD